MDPFLKWKVKFIIPEPQNRLLWLYKFTSYSLVWALTLDPKTSDPFPLTYSQVKAPKENTQNIKSKHCINNVVKPSCKKIYLLWVKDISHCKTLSNWISVNASNTESPNQKTLREHKCYDAVILQKRPSDV